MRHDGPMPPGTGLSPDAHALVDAVAAMNSDLEIGSVLQHIVQSACALTGARYGALGVIGADNGLGEFVTHGLDEATRTAIGDLPHGQGILGLLIREPRSIRLERLQDHPASFGFPPNHPPMTSFLGAPIHVRGTVFGNLYLTEKAGGAPFTETDEHLVEALAGAAAIAVENARAFTLSELQRAWLEATSRLNAALRPGTTRADALAMVATAVRAVTSAAAVGILAPEGEADPFVVREGREADGLTALLDQVRGEVTSALAGEAPAPVRLTADRIAVAVPVRAPLFGTTALVAVLDRGHLDAATGPAELDLLTAFGAQAGLALDRLHALAEREELAVVSDRDRIARDLHDLVIQRLFASGLQLQGLRGRLEDHPVAERIDQVVGDLDATIHQIRSTIFALRQPGQESPRARLAAVVVEYAEVLGFPPGLRVQGPVDTLLGATLADHVLAVVREALSNAARHARASRVDVTLAIDPTGVTVTVADDGTGLPADRHDSGLANLRTRAEALGGQFVTAQAQPHGTLVSWSAPLR